MKSWLLAIVSVSVIFIGIYGLFLQKENALSEIDISQNNSILTSKKFKVYIAKREILKSTPVSRKDFEIKMISESRANKLSLNKDEVFDFSDDLYARKSFKKNQIIFEEDIYNKNDIDYLKNKIKPGYLPYFLNLDSTSINGIIKVNSLVNIMALSSTTENLSSENYKDVGGNFKNVAINLIVQNVKILKISRDNNILDILNNRTISKNKIRKNDIDVNDNKSNSAIIVVLELTPKQVSILTVARSIAKIEIVQSIKSSSDKKVNYQFNPSLLSANAGDVLGGLNHIREFRADKEKIN